MWLLMSLLYMRNVIRGYREKTVALKLCYILFYNITDLGMFTEWNPISYHNAQVLLAQKICTTGPKICTHAFVTRCTYINLKPCFLANAIGESSCVLISAYTCNQQLRCFTWVYLLMTVCTLDVLYQIRHHVWQKNSYNVFCYILKVQLSKNGKSVVYNMKQSCTAFSITHEWHKPITTENQ